MELKDRIKGEETNDCQTEGGENRQLPTEILDFRTDSTKLYHLSQSLRKAFPFNFQLTIQTEAQWALEETQRIIGDDGTILLAVLNKVGYGTFGRFFGFLGLTASQMEHGLYSFLEEWEDEEDEDYPSDIPSGIKWFVDEINRTGTIAKDIVLSTSKILSLSKESLINDFVIPFYKIPKSSSLDLRDLAEEAFEKGLERTLWVGAKNCFTVYDCFNLLDTADFVSIFEYFLEQQDEVLKDDFQAKGLKAGYSLHCLRQYPSGFTGSKEYDSWFPRAFIISDDKGAKMTFDEVKEFIKGLPTELDRKVATALLERARNEDFAEGIELSFHEGYQGRKFTKGVRSVWYFDGVKGLAEHLDIPCLNNTFGEEIHQIFRDYVSEADDDLLSILAEGNDWFGRSEQLLYEKFGGNPSWIAYEDYGFLLTLSERVKVPKKILKCYRKVANSVHNDYRNGNY